MPRTTYWRLALVALVALASLAAACGDNFTCPAAAGPTDSGVSDAGTPLRRLTRRGLFGDTPIENRFLDPRFGQIDGSAWGGYSPRGEPTAVVTRMQLPTPGGQPAVRLAPVEGSGSFEFGGSVKSTNVPLEVSIWVGHASGVAVEPPAVALVGMVDQDLSSVDLLPDDTAPVTRAGVTWQRYSVSLAGGPVAWSNLELTSASADPLYLTSPLLVPTGSVAPRWFAARRPATPAERDLYQGLARSVRDRLGRPPRGTPRR
jgi:hypothetical protein